MRTRLVEREYKRKYREKIRADPVKYASYLAKGLAYSKQYYLNMTPQEKEKRREYTKKYNKEYAKRNPEKIRACQKRYRNKIKDKVFSFYGRKCACCNENRKEFLCIDHIEGGGFKHRKAIKGTGNNLYGWLFKQGFPKGYRTLCHNCNMSLGLYGYCPHKTR